MTEETEQEMPEARITEPAPDPIAVLKAEIESLRDQRLRALAEVENIRRRSEREKIEASQICGDQICRDMVHRGQFLPRPGRLPAGLARSRDPQVKAVLDGVEATDRQLLATLERHGVKPVSTEDGKFDPNLHQAIAEVPGNGKPAGSIVDVCNRATYRRPAAPTRDGDGGAAGRHAAPNRRQGVGDGGPQYRRRGRVRPDGPHLGARNRASTRNDIVRRAGSGRPSRSGPRRGPAGGACANGVKLTADPLP